MRRFSQPLPIKGRGCENSGTVLKTEVSHVLRLNKNLLNLISRYMTSTSE